MSAQLPSSQQKGDFYVEIVFGALPCIRQALLLTVPHN
jgi:hypothetical protein